MRAFRLLFWRRFGSKFPVANPPAGVSDISAQAEHDDAEQQRNYDQQR
jgi:hypothetical protein